MLFAVATGLARPLSPGQLLWINLLSDVLPAMGLAMTPPDPSLVERPLPASDAQVLSRSDLPLLVRDGTVIAGSALAAQAAARVMRGPEAASAVGFTSLVTGQLLYALACAPKGRPVGSSLLGTLAASFSAQGAALAIPGLRQIVGSQLGAADLALSAATGVIPWLLISALDRAWPAPQASAASASKA
jgi:Ca2+-transporting ATPase